MRYTKNEGLKLILQAKPPPHLGNIHFSLLPLEPGQGAESEAKVMKGTQSSAIAAWAAARRAIGTR